MAAAQADYTKAIESCLTDTCAVAVDSSNKLRVLSRFGSMEIDNRKQVIRLKPFRLP